MPIQSSVATLINLIHNLLSFHNQNILLEHQQQQQQKKLLMQLHIILQPNHRNLENEKPFDIWMPKNKTHGASGMHI